MSRRRRVAGGEWGGLGASPSRAEVVCAVCRGLLRLPAALPCGHRFCLACLGRAGPACPLCRRRAGAWLRRARATGRLVDEPLWAYIQLHFGSELDRPASDPDPEPAPKLSRPGEIRAEYRAELDKLRSERRLFEQKYSSENEKLIRELQEQEKLEAESRNAILKNDEKYAMELSTSLNAIEEPPTPSSSTPSSSTAAPKKDKSNIFYDHSEKKINGSKTQTLDGYFEKTNGSNNNADSKTVTVSPELISTAGRCGRFIKIFFTEKLWRAKEETKDDLNNSTKAEPKQWEPDASLPGQNKELLVHSGTITEKNNLSSSMLLSNDKDDRLKKELCHLDLESESEDSLAADLCYFKPIQPIAVVRSNEKIIKSLPRKKIKTTNSDVVDEKILDMRQIKNALENLRGSTISNTYENSAFVCRLSVPICAEMDTKTPVKMPVNESPKKRKSKPSKSPNNSKSNVNKLNNSSATNDISATQKPSNSSKNGSNRNSVTTSPRRSRRNKISQSCVKLGTNKADSVDRLKSTRLKRSLSFNNVNNNSFKVQPLEISPSRNRIDKKSTAQMNNNGIENDTRKSISKIRIGKNTTQQKCDSNGHGKDIDDNTHKLQKPKNGFINKKCQNGNAKNGSILLENDNLYCDSSFSNKNDTDISLANLDPSILEEQKYIENLIIQEKKDHDLAKKLQREISGKSIFTGYTIRTAAKRQATITELLSTPKKMKI